MRPAAKNPSLLAKKVDAILSYTTITIPLGILAKKGGGKLASSSWEITE